MNKRIPVTIVTPERLAWEGEVESLIVPAHEGQLGILPGHAPLLAHLKPGTIVMRSGAEEPRLMAVSGGFVEVFHGRVSLFAETAELADEIDAERARLAAERAKKTLKLPHEEKMDLEAQAALERALARLRAVEAASKRRSPRSASPPSPHRE